MSEFYWPEAKGIYELTDSAGVTVMIEFDGECWVAADGTDIETSVLQSWGYLGVRREPAAQPVEATPDPDDANLAYAVSVMTRLRAAKKPGEFERIALECVPVLCQMMGAE